MFNPASPNSSDDPAAMKTSRDYLRIFLSGFAMGSADIVPGVSGGTMAFILGIYEALLNGIKSVNLEVIRLVLTAKIKEALALVPWKFLLTLAAGIATAVLTLVNFLSWMLENEPEFLFAFFFGLVLASIIAIGAKVTKWTVPIVLGLVIGAVVAWVISALTPEGDTNHSTIILFLSGMVAIMAMILPGISGSFILLLLGQYEYVVNAVKDFDLQTVITVGIGALVGITGFSRILSWLLARYEMLTIAVLTGFMIGSLRKIWPWREASTANLDDPDHAEFFTKEILPKINGDFWIAILLLVVGFAVVTALDHLQSKSNPVVLGLQRLTGGSRKSSSTV
jgi:putative membrane protein